MKLFACLLILIVRQHFVHTTQPYFPEQVIFSRDGNKTLIVIDEVYQRAYLKLNVSGDDTDIAYVMRHIPYSKSGSAQTKHYVQLILNENSRNNGCSYLTYWEYSSNRYGLFPFHWGNDSSYRIKNYLNFNYPMIHLMNASANEDYWYSNKTCRVDTGEVYRCQEIYFQKNTDIPIRYSEVIRDDRQTIRRIENYTIYSVGIPTYRYFKSIPQNWSDVCRDGDLGVSYHPDEITLKIKESAKVEVWLPAPPHKIDGNDTVVIYWRPLLYKEYFEWTPKQLVFDGTNFQKRQILTITRLADAEETLFIPVCSGGGYDKVPCFAMYLPVH
ncbi:hypothetical protein I4U23_016456 [Adineta vaga]|nr:hypothetical protein I4U23_016456 [Adineta vaga]